MLDNLLPKNSSPKGLISPIYTSFLHTEIKKIPEHIAIIQDGNRRFAQKKGEKPMDGHEYGTKTTEKTLEWCLDLDIEKITLYTLSTENLNRPQKELDHLFDLIEERLIKLKDEEKIHNKEVKITGIGEIEKLPNRVKEALKEVEASTREYNRYSLDIAIGYGGRQELLKATKDILKKINIGEIEPEEIDEKTVSNHIYTNTQDVDLLIRTGGEERTSNFLPWQANGSESVVYFCDPYWPEFRKIDFLRAVRTFSERETGNKNKGIDRIKNIYKTLI